MRSLAILLAIIGSGILALIGLTAILVILHQYIHWVDGAPIH